MSRNTHAALSLSALGHYVHLFACTAARFEGGERAWFKPLPELKRNEDVVQRGPYRCGGVDLQISWLIFSAGLSYSPKGGLDA